MPYIGMTAVNFMRLGFDSNMVDWCLENQEKEKVNTNILISFFTLFPPFLEHRNKSVYNSLVFPNPDDVTHFCHRVPITPEPDSLLSHHNVDSLSFSLPADRGTMTLEIAFFAGKKLVYLDEYGPESSYMIPTFDAYDFPYIMKYLVAILSWVEGKKRPDEDDTNSNAASDDA
uniref:Uncharacterized protein n=1 Tax=viral metagenome TaxID=1070528 RepID=A0A6C0EEE4_9ZZZZ